MPEFPGFIGESYTARALAFDAQRAMNLYLEADESGTGKWPRALLGRPGLTLWQTLGTSPVRGIWTGLIDNLPGSSGSDLCFVVAGSKLYQVTDDGFPAALLGDVGTDSTNSPCQFQVNGTQLLISSAGSLWLLTNSTLSKVFYNNGTGTVNTSGTAVTLVSGDPFDSTQVGSYIRIAGTSYLISAFIDASHVTLSSSAGTQSAAVFYVLTGNTSTPVYVSAAQIAFLDTYFIALPAGSKVYYISATNDGANWNPLDFGVKAAFPDNIAAILADHENLWLFGSEASEVDQDTGGSSTSTFPFQRNPGAIISQGCRAPFSAASINNGVAFIGGDTRGNPIAWFTQGFAPQRISTHAIEAAWGDYPTITDAIAFVFVQDGHQFWVISFPTANTTWIWDATANAWSEAGWWNGTSIDRLRVATHGYVFGLHLTGDWQSGALYQMSPAFFDDNGVSIHAIRTAPHLSQEEFRSFYDWLRLATTNGLRPTLAWSDDLGENYSTPKHGTLRRLSSSSAVSTAKFTEWRRMGYGRDRIYSAAVAPSAGTVTASGTAVTWVSGDTFAGILAGDPIALGAGLFTVASVTNPTHLVLTATAGTIPSLYHLCGLCGCFTDSGGRIVGRPFWLGNGPTTLTVPLGATQLQLGTDDDLFADNLGSFVTAVSVAGVSANHTVAGTAQPWLHTGGINAAYPYGIADGTAPVAVACTAGAIVVVTYVSGTVSAGGATSFNNANGNPSFLAQGVGSSGTFAPGVYFAGFYSSPPAARIAINDAYLGVGGSTE